jgi:hypothetical protein
LPWDDAAADRAAPGSSVGDGHLQFDCTGFSGAGDRADRADYATAADPGPCRARAERGVALRETLLLWIYGVVVLLAGRVIGLHFFGEGIALHLNGSLVGATRLQSPREVYTGAAYNGIFFALIPYMVFRLRGYSHAQMNLKSSNLKSDVIVIFVAMAVGCFMDLALGGTFLRLTHHQQVVGGLLSFIFHLVGTDLPVMIFIYAILLPRYAKLTTPVTAFLLGAASYPAMHVFESWTRYDTFTDSVLS